MRTEQHFKSNENDIANLAFTTNASKMDKTKCKQNLIIIIINTYLLLPEEKLYKTRKNNNSNWKSCENMRHTFTPQKTHQLKNYYKII